jgi:hypothetical protein
MFNTFAEEECCDCGVLFGMTTKFKEHRLKDKRNFFCPNGHEQAYIKSTAQILQEKLDEKQRLLNEKTEQIYSLQNENERLKKQTKPKNKRVKQKIQKSKTGGGGGGNTIIKKILK